MNVAPLLCRGPAAPRRRGAGRHRPRPPAGRDRPPPFRGWRGQAPAAAGGAGAALAGGAVAGSPTNERSSFHHPCRRHRPQSGQLTDLRYNGVDERDRPYTVTASAAHQVSPERINLVDPKGDISLEIGSWLMVQSCRGVYVQHDNQLDLSGDVALYRDDGLTLLTDVGDPRPQGRRGDQRRAGARRGAVRHARRPGFRGRRPWHGAAVHRPGPAGAERRGRR